jgi:hypothetical protein
MEGSMQSSLDGGDPRVPSPHPHRPRPYGLCDARQGARGKDWEFFMGYNDMGESEKKGGRPQ